MQKLSIKTLKSDLFSIDCEPTDTIAIIKEKISLSQPEFPIARQKLIFAGKVLVDESTIGDIGVTESDFLVIMATKEKAGKPSPSPSVAAAPAPAPPIQSQPQPQVAPQQPPAVVSGYSSLLLSLTSFRSISRNKTNYGYGIPRERS